MKKAITDVVRNRISSAAGDHVFELSIADGIALIDGLPVSSEQPEAVMEGIRGTLTVLGLAFRFRKF